MEPYVGEIRMFAGSVEPVDWKFCNGQLLTIQQYPALYSLIGTTYGGNGTTDFALPNLQGRLPVGSATSNPPGMASTYPVGAVGGSTTVTVTQAQMPAHTHAFSATTADATTITPGSTVTFATSPSNFTGYAGNPPTLLALNAQAVTSAGGSQAHENRMPAICINYIIAVQGLYPDFP
jgi:microcystin-dependent protein